MNAEASPSPTDDKSRQNVRPRLRFSVRTLLILLTLACCYAACWWPTKRAGVFDVEFKESPISAVAVAPLIVRGEAPGYGPPSMARAPEAFGDARECCYYFWFFGAVVKLACVR